MLETNFSFDNVFLLLDDSTLGSAIATLGTSNILGEGDGVTTIFTGVLSNFPLSEITDIKINGVSIGAITITEGFNGNLILSGIGLTGTNTVVNSFTGVFTLDLSSAPLLSDLITLEFVSQESEWSSISGIRNKFRIMTNDGGLIELSSDPQFRVSSTPVEVLISPLNLYYNSNDWKLRVPATNKVSDYLPRHIKSSLILPEYLDSLQNISIDELHDSIIRLRNLRRWNVMDSDYLDLYLQTMGMYFKSEIFDIETKRRFIKELPAFLELSGTKYTFNYLSFVVGALFEAKHLWSKDYIDFILEEDIPVIDQDLYYPTNHVQLNFDINAFGTLDPRLIIEIFYVLASVPLVLERINQELESNSVNVNTIMTATYEVYMIADDVT